MSDLPVRVLAVLGAAAIGAFGTGGLIRVVARLAWPHELRGEVLTEEEIRIDRGRGLEHRGAKTGGLPLAIDPHRAGEHLGLTGFEPESARIPGVAVSIARAQRTSGEPAAARRECRVLGRRDIDREELPVAAPEEGQVVGGATPGMLAALGQIETQASE